jgi:hypothetical protein
VQRASWAEHEDRDWRAVIIGRARPLKARSLDGTLIRVPDTPANRAVFGSVGTGDDSSPFLQLRALPLNDASTRALLVMPHGPAGTGKAAAEQELLDAAMQDYPHLFTEGRLWLMRPPGDGPGLVKVSAPRGPTPGPPHDRADQPRRPRPGLCLVTMATPPPGPRPMHHYHAQLLGP